MGIQQLQDAFEGFKTNIKTLNLSTLDQNNQPRASYAPFVEDEDGCFYIFVSQLASHTQDLLINSEASILLLEDEKETRQIFARQRISYQCQVEIIEADESSYAERLDAMEKRFGNVVELLRTLPDFLLFRLKPYEGQYVKGFGKAYKLVGADLKELEHITPDIE
ncbi:MAG TPA: HugZ family protein [Leucothrix sp.]|nr:HugZ family protein [Leucothrix sp.]